MPYQPERFHDVAKLVNTSQIVPAGEGRYRTVVGRAYYGAYWATCQAVCQTYRISPPLDLPHEALSQTISKVRNDPDVSKLGTLLDTLRQRRVDADYKPRLTITESHADDAVTDAAEILKLLPTVQNRLPKVDPREGRGV